MSEYEWRALTADEIIGSLNRVTEIVRLQQENAELKYENERLKGTILEPDFAKLECENAELRAAGKKVCEILKTSDMYLTAMLETAECRGDEDCDHCMAMGLESETEEVLSTYGKLFE